jgi:hypothetical protein
MEQAFVRRTLASLLMLVLSAGTPVIAASQEVQPPPASLQQELGPRALKFVVDRFAIDAAIPVPKTSQPLSGGKLVHLQRASAYLRKDQPSVPSAVVYGAWN